jgi:hypothetical protein
MKFKSLHLIYILVAGTGLITFTSFSGGKTGSSTAGCGGSGCHTASTATGIFISFDGNSALTSYTPGKKYAIQVTITNTNYSSNNNAEAGFNLNANKGSISNIASGTAQTSGEMNHTTPKKLSSGTTNFTFDWTAPAAGSGLATFNIAGNIVNGDDGTAGDAWALTTKTLAEEVSSTVKKATITTIASSAITNTGATISAQINANNANTAAEVQFGTTTSYGITKAMTPASIAGSSTTSASANLTGLIADMTYNYRIKATNSAGDTFSSNSTFKTTASGAAIFQSDKESTTIYPNPASNYTIIKGENITKDFEFSVTNTSGKKLSLPITAARADEIKLNTSALSKGIYYIQWNENGNRKSIPLFIEH